MYIYAVVLQKNLQLHHVNRFGAGQNYEIWALLLWHTALIIHSAYHILHSLKGVVFIAQMAEEYVFPVVLIVFSKEARGYMIGKMTALAEYALFQE